MLNRIERLVVPVGLLLSLLFLQTTVSAYQEERLLEKLSWKTEPIKIVKINANGEPIELGRKFHGRDDWLNKLTITVQNVSQKAIARVELTLGFPPPKGSGPEKPTVVVPMIFGKDPALASPLEVIELVMPDERVEIELHESILPGIKEDLSKLGYGPIIRHAEILVRSVTFVDGSEWKADRILYPNPNNPTEKINPTRPLLEVLGPAQPRRIGVGNADLFAFLDASLKRLMPQQRLVLSTNSGDRRYPNFRRHCRAIQFGFEDIQTPVDLLARDVHIVVTTLLRIQRLNSCGRLMGEKC